MKKSVLVGSLLICSIIAIISITLYLYQNQTSSTNFSFVTNAESPPTPTIDPNPPINIALAGFAGPGHDGGSLTDTIILAHIDPKTKITHLISIPRDTWVNLPSGTEASISAKINAAFAIGNDKTQYQKRPDEFKGDNGGGELLKHTIQQVTGIQPDYYLAINFTGFISSLNILGNLNIDVPYTFDDYFYPLRGEEDNPCDKSPEEIEALTATMAAHLLEREFPCRYEHIHFDQGKQTMSAETALKFVRSRHSEYGGGDFGRSQRQLALLNAVRDKLISFGTITKIIPLASNALSSVQTDLDLDVITAFLTKINLSDYQLISITLTTDNVFDESKSDDGQYILIPKQTPSDFKFIHQYIQTEIASPSAATINN